MYFKKIILQLISPFLFEFTWITLWSSNLFRKVYVEQPSIWEGTYRNTFSFLDPFGPIKDKKRFSYPTLWDGKTSYGKPKIPLRFQRCISKRTWYTRITHSFFSHTPILWLNLFRKCIFGMSPKIDFWNSQLTIYYTYIICS